MSGAEHLARPRRRGDEAEVEDPPLGRARPSSASWRLDGAEPAERLAQRVGGHEPAEALAGVDQALVAQHLERLADRDPAAAVGSPTARPRSAAAARRRTRRPRRRSPQLVGDRLGSGRSLTCHILVYMPARRAQGTPQARWPSPPPPRSSSSTSVYARLPERVALGRERLGRPLTFAEKILRQPPARRPRARRSSGAAATPTSTPTASPCRTPPPRWRCCSS